MQTLVAGLQVGFEMSGKLWKRALTLKMIDRIKAIR
jgi:hypothetical protein